MNNSTANEVEMPSMDGKITVGPIRLPAGWNGMLLMRRMTEFGLSISRDDQASFSMKPGMGNFMMTADGPGVMGYLVDAEMLEAEETDLECFAQPFIKGLPFDITGEHDLGGGKRLRCHTRIEACPEAFYGVQVTRSRELISI
jgi:hypothetical protein